MKKLNEIRMELEAIHEWLESFDEIDTESKVGFEFYGQWITHPFYDDTARFEVDPIDFYGEDNIRAFVEKYHEVIG